MDRNDKRFWYDRGYSLGTIESKRDAILPRVIGVWLLVLIAWWDITVAFMLLGLWTPFEYLDYRSSSRKAAFKRDHWNPGKRWE